MSKVDGTNVRLVDAADERLAELLPESLAVTLGGIAEVCREGLMAVAVEAGLATALAIMNQEADALCGMWNARDPQRSHVRSGTTPTSVVMGGQRLPIRRPRVHAVDDGRQAGEVASASYGVFAQGDLLQRTVIERMLAGVATRSFARAADPIGDEQRKAARSTSKSAVSRRFVTGTKKALDELVCTNMIESMFSIARTTTRNVKRWRDDSDMRRRWCAAGLLEAEHRFRRVRGHAQMPDLVAALARHAATVTPPCQTDNNEIAA